MIMESMVRNNNPEIIKKASLIGSGPGQSVGGMDEYDDDGNVNVNVNVNMNMNVDKYDAIDVKNENIAGNSSSKGENEKEHVLGDKDGLNICFREVGRVDRPGFISDNKTQEERMVDYLSNVQAFIAPSKETPNIEHCIGTIKRSLDLDKDPANEYCEMDYILSSVFPEIFGSQTVLSSYKNKPMPKERLKHLVSQFTRHAARSKEFLYYILNIHRRHTTNAKSNAKLRSLTTEENKEFVDLINNKDLSGKLDQCIKDPKLPEAKSLVRQLDRYIKFVCRSIPYSDDERESLRSSLFAGAQYAGLYSLYWTISQDSKGSLVIRLAFPLTTNALGNFPSDPDMLPEVLGGVPSAGPRRGMTATKTPAAASAAAAAAAAAAATDAGCEQTFETILEDEEKCPVISIPVLKNFNEVISANPVAAAETFRLILKCFWKTVLGINMESETRTSKPYQANVSGFYGRVKLAFGVLEWGDQSKNLHAHGLAATNLSPEICRLCAEFPFLANRIISIMEATIRTDLPIARLINEVTLKIKNQYRGPTPRPSCTSPPDPLKNKQQYLDKVEIAIIYLQMHKHMPTCYTRKTGETGCRSGILYVYVEKSGVRRLVLRSDDRVLAYENFDEQTKSVASSMSTIPGLALSMTETNSKNRPVLFPTADDRAIGKYYLNFILFNFKRNMKLKVY
jgi:hypothetical protein